MLGTIESGKSQILQNNNNLNNNNINASEVRNSTTNNRTAIEDDNEIEINDPEIENLIYNDDVQSDNCNSQSDDISLQSFNSEIELIEEIILLPNSIYSDDDNTSNDNDCIYAYRGVNNSNNNLNNNPICQDDETDFLEMDFDPEPSSEQENFVEIPEFHNFNQNFIVICSNDASTSNSILDQDHLENIPSTQEPNAEIVGCTKSIDTTLLMKNISNKSATSSSTQTLNINISEVLPEQNDNKIPKLSVMENKVINPSKSKNTGTIPKMITQNINGVKITNSNSSDVCFRSSLKFNSKSREVNYKKTRDFQDRILYRFDNNCLDCTETEFLMQTNQNLRISEICKTCRRNNSFKDKFMDSYNISNYNRNFGEVIDHIKINGITSDTRISKSKSSNDFSQLQGEEKERKFHEMTSFIHSQHCDDEKIICEALKKIGITPNVNTISHYLEENNSDMTTDLVEYLLMLSKKKCNYKKLIHTLHLCCDEQLELTFEALNPGDSKIESIEVHSSEIFKRWTPDTNLRNMYHHIRNKHFHEFNVLGKIVNILRQGKDCNIVFNIPQYYETGYIFIKRKF